MTTNSIDNTVSNDFYVQKSTSGATVTETISQTSNSAGATARQIISVAGSTADDPCVKFNIGATNGFAVGPENSASDILKFVTGSNVNPTSGTDIMTITTGGAIQQPLQPSFLAYVSATVNNVTGDSTTYVVIPDAEVFDTNSDYNAATGMFTAPITGAYWFQASFRVSDIGVNHKTCYGFIYTSNFPYVGQWCDGAVVANFGSLIFTAQTLCDMDAGDVAHVRTPMGMSTKTIDLIGGTLDTRGYNSYFSGNLEC